MKDAIAVLRDGTDGGTDRGGDAARALANLREVLRVSGFASVDYAELRDADTLAPLDAASDNARLFVAARIGGTRLIDNMAV